MGRYGDLGSCIEVFSSVTVFRHCRTVFIVLVLFGVAFFGRDEITSCNDNPRKSQIPSKYPAFT